MGSEEIRLKVICDGQADQGPSLFPFYPACFSSPGQPTRLTVEISFVLLSLVFRGLNAFRSVSSNHGCLSVLVCTYIFQIVTMPEAQQVSSIDVHPTETWLVTAPNATIISHEPDILLPCGEADSFGFQLG